eukprot:3652769-Alexandrium_andersonii.AAC.1
MAGRRWLGMVEIGVVLGRVDGAVLGVVEVILEAWPGPELLVADWADGVRVVGAVVLVCHVDGDVAWVVGLVRAVGAGVSDRRGGCVIIGGCVVSGSGGVWVVFVVGWWGRWVVE